MALFDDLSAKIDDVRTQVMTALDTLKGGAGGAGGDTSLSLTGDQKTQLLSKLDDLTSAVKSAITTTGTTPTPTPTGTPDVTGAVPPTPTGPTPAPAPTPNPNPGP